MVTIKKPRRKATPSKKWFYDFETEEWDRPVIAIAQCEDGDEHIFRGEQAAAQLGAFMREVGGTWIAHAGGIFDHLLVFRDTSWPREVILAGSSILQARDHARRKRPALIWRDSYPRWNMSLAKVGKAIGLPKLEVDRARIDALTPAEVETYCRRDVEIVRRAWMLEDEWFARYHVTASTAGTGAVKLLEAMDPVTWTRLSQHLVDPALALGGPYLEAHADTQRPDDCGALHAIRGGRVETRHVGEVAEPVYVYDLHSSYPSQWAKGALPIGLEQTDSVDLRAWGWLDRVTWHQPSRAYDELTAYELGQDGRGVGELTAWLTWEQAAELDRRGLKPRRHGVGWAPTGEVPAFADQFVRTLYSLKEGGGAESFFAKITLNALSGKTQENPLRFRYLLREDRRDQPLTGRWLDHYEPHPAFVRVSPYHQPLLAAAVLGRARITLANTIEAVERAGHRFLYCDTDSLHTTMAPDDFSRIADYGPGLGQWGLEVSGGSARYLASKTYWIDPPAAKAKTAAKGMPKDILSREHFDAAARGEVVRLSREGLGKIRSGSDAGRRVQLTRTLRPVHPGRARLADGTLRYI
jgi:hypothetical protein